MGNKRVASSERLPGVGGGGEAMADNAHGVNVHKNREASVEKKRGKGEQSGTLARGVVHAWVGQKHLNCFILKYFFYRSSLANVHLCDA